MSIPKEKIIDIRDLRIGNYLLYDGRIVHVTFLSMDIDDEYEESIGFCELDKTTNEKADWNRALCDKLDKIPVTAEWLEKFGFIESNSYNEKARHFRKDGFDQLADYGGQIIILPEVGFASLSCGYYENQIDCPYVHRLQNLCFALTGEELILKETV